MSNDPSIPQDPAPTPSAVTSVGDWKAKANGTPVTLPSGNVARLRRPGMDSFVRRGMIPNILMAPIQTMLGQGEEAASEQVKDMAEDPQTIIEFFALMDDICVEVFAEPVLNPLPDHDQPRDPNLLYVDEIDMDDKSFAFEYAVGGPRNVQQFRDRQAEMLADLSPSQGDEPQTQ